MIRKARTENGWVRGIEAADPRITAFKGVPFAAPPVGENRWRAPQPCEDWEGVREAYRFAPISVQDTPGIGDIVYNREWHVDPSIEMAEDCLYLNIWTGAKSPEERQPVLVWFFGGGLQWGYPSEMEFDGERLARRGVVVVTVNYRINVFGFLAHPEISAQQPDAPANFGNLDQQAGLRWVVRNIAAFGGDPENITIAGQSAGGGSVMSQMTCPDNFGLFQRAMVMSAMIRDPYGEGGIGKPCSLEEAEENGRQFFEFLGVSSLEEARKLDALYIRDRYAEYAAGHPRMPGRVLRVPVADVQSVELPRLFQGGYAQKLEKLPAVLLRLLKRTGLPNAALAVRIPDHCAHHHRPLKQSEIVRTGHLAHHAAAARRLPGDRDILRITAERRNIANHPAQTRLLIQISEICRSVRLLRADLRMRQKTEHIDAVVHRHHHDAAARKPLPVKFHLRRIAPLQAAAEKPHEHRLPLLRRFRARPDVQIQAVLRHLNGGIHMPLAIVHDISNARGVLHGDRREAIRLPHAFPVLARLRRAPAVLTHGRRRERHSLERRNPRIRRLDAAHPSVFCPCFPDHNCSFLPFWVFYHTIPPCSTCFSI